MKSNLIHNRGFKYGDGLFETIRVSNGKILNLDKHFERLSKGLATLQMEDFEVPFSKIKFQEILEKFLEERYNANRSSNKNLRIRISFFRTAGGLYTPQKNSFDYVIEADDLLEATYNLNKQGLHLGFCTRVQLSMDELSNLKTSSALPYVLAGIEKKERGWDDCFLVNSKSRISETIAANVFVLKDNCLFTPARSEGCVVGVMRNTLLEIAADMQFPIKEIEMSKAFVLDAEEVFLTNAIQGIRWVETILGTTNKMKNSFAQKLVPIINEYLLD